VPLFRYQVTDKNGKILAGVINASSEADARQRLISRGYRLLMITPVDHTSRQRQSKNPAQPRSAAKSWVSVPAKELMVFFRSLQRYLQSGMTLFQALTEISNLMANKKMRAVACKMASRVETGGRLSDAMQEFPLLFPPHIVNCVYAGEVGGFLPVILGDIALDYELSQRASNRWIRLAVFLGWINAIAVVMVAPLVPSLYTPGVEDLQGAVTAYFHFVVPRIVLPTIVAFTSYYLIKILLRHPRLRIVRDSLILKLPAYGMQSKMRSIAMFLRVLWRLQAAGILPIRAWETASRVAENLVISSKLLAQVPRIQSGARFSEVLVSTGCFNIGDVQLLSAAKASGQVVDALERMSVQYEDAASMWATRAKWWAIHPVLIANILAVGYAFYCVTIKTLCNQIEWVDRFFKVE
jgi:type II secretory pathway component PulF